MAPSAHEPHLVAAWLGRDARRVKLHDVMVLAPPPRAYAALLDLPLDDLPLTRALFVLRGIAHQRGMTVRELFTTPPFRLLEEEAPHEIVFEISRRRFRAVMNFRVVPLRLGSVVSTTTWVETWGWPARIIFAAYWLFVAPFSGLIRRELLRVAKRRAER